jgi:hypothetical protein
VINFSLLLDFLEVVSYFSQAGFWTRKEGRKEGRKEEEKGKITLGSAVMPLHLGQVCTLKGLFRGWSL